MLEKRVTAIATRRPIRTAVHPCEQTPFAESKAKDENEPGHG
jgi:hypothetical protein